MQKETIQQTIAALQADIRKHALDPAHPPMLLPVTKTQPVEVIASLTGTGVTEIGENRVQEILEKYPHLSGDFSFHLIGQLQSNKIKYIMGKVCMVQSLDRLSLAQSLDHRAQAAGLRVPVLIEVNIGGESQKAGIDPASVISFARTVAGYAGLHVRGLMAVMPLVSEPESIRPLFRKMRCLFERLRDTAIDHADIAELSMGMSGDWQVAAQEGATILRIGSAIFGQRPSIA